MSRQKKLGDAFLLRSERFLAISEGYQENDLRAFTAFQGAAAGSFSMKPEFGCYDCAWLASIGLIVHCNDPVVRSSEPAELLSKLVGVLRGQGKM